jgi:DnaK suppressor protein
VSKSTATTQATPPRAATTKAAAAKAAKAAQAHAQPAAVYAADKKNLPEPFPEPMHVIKPPAKPDPKLANVWKTKAGRDLTDAEVLAMPDSEYMSDKQLEFFRGRLQAQKDSLLSNAGETTEHLREDTSIVPDPADRATIEEEHALELRTRDRERKLLKKITQSLGRIDSGDYGYCDETGEPIGLGRLIARPTATLSLEAQQRREMKQKMFGD